MHPVILTRNWVATIACKTLVAALFSFNSKNNILMRDVARELSGGIMVVLGIFSAICVLVSLFSTASDSYMTPWEVMLFMGPHLAWVVGALVLILVGIGIASKN